MALNPQRGTALPSPVVPAKSGAPSAAALRRVLRRARDGVALNVDEAAIAMTARGDDLADLCASAARVRDAGLTSSGRRGPNGRLPVSYSRKVFIPITHLCRDTCHYCTFVTVPGKLRAQGLGMYMEPDEILDVARRGAELGCKEALFTLGDRPEARWDEARQWLDERGYNSTLDYVRAMAIRVLEETGLLPHLNPGVMTWSELSRLKPVAPSMGMMLETTSRRLFETKGLAHYGSPDKDPEVRLRTLADAGRLSIPFTTGLLVGIGETLTERAETLHAIRRSHKEFGHVQEVIVQNFRAKDHTAMSSVPDAGIDDFVATVAVARLVLGPKMRVQAPPNLVSRDECLALIGAGVDDWGGVSPLTPDHVNPERPWPALDELAAVTAEAGYDLVQRLTAQPPYVQAGAAWIDPRVQAHVAALADPDTGFALDVDPEGRPWQEPDEAAESLGRIDLHSAIDAEGRLTATRSDLNSAFGDWESIREKVGELAARAPERIDTDVVAALRSAERDPAGCTDDEYLALATADGPALDAVAALADSLRRDTVGDDVTFVVNRNINFTNICYTGCRFCAFAQRKGDADAYSLSTAEVADRAWEAHVAGATEVCMQGGIDPELPVTGYADLVRAVKATGAVDARACVLADGDRQRRHQERAVHSGVVDRPARGRSGHHPGYRSRDLGRRGPLGLDEGQAAHVDVDRGRHHRPRSGAAVEFDDDVRPCRHPAALGRAPARAARYPGPDRRVHRVRAAAVRAPVLAAVPGRWGPPRADPPRQPRGPRAGADHVARQDLSHSDQLGQTRRRAHAGDAQRRCERPRRHVDGGDHLADGRLGVRLGEVRRGTRRDRRGHRPPRPSAHHHLRAAGGVTTPVAASVLSG